MNEKFKQLRKLALLLDVSGTASVVSNTKLYQGGYGYVLLQVYVPVTQNRFSDTSQLCTVHRVTVDAAGNRRQFNLDKYNLIYVETLKFNNEDYLLFECPMPKAFTDTLGDLELIIEYCEIKGDKIVSRITSNVFRTVVSAGGISDGDTIDTIGGELARLNGISSKMDKLAADVQKLLSTPDIQDADHVGTASVSITPIGNLKFSNLKGVGVQDVVFNETDTEGNNVYDIVLTNGVRKTFISPKGKIGETGRVGPQGKTGEKGEGFSIKKTYPSIEEMNADFSNFEIKEGDFVLIAAESVDIEDNAKLFVKGSNGFKYLVDMSGATGIKGESGVNGVDSLFNGVCTHAAPTIGNAVSFNITEFNRVPIVGDTFYKLQTLDNSTRRWLVLYSVTASDDAAQTVTCLTSDALELGATLEYSKYDFSITESQWSSLYNSTFAAMTTVTLDRAVTSVQYVTPIVNAEMQTKYGIVISDVDGASVTLKAIRKPAETLSISILVEG